MKMYRIFEHEVRSDYALEFLVIRAESVEEAIKIFIEAITVKMKRYELLPGMVVSGNVFTLELKCLDDVGNVYYQKGEIRYADFIVIEMKMIGDVGYYVDESYGYIMDHHLLFHHMVPKGKNDKSIEED